MINTTINSITDVTVSTEYFGHVCGDDRLAVMAAVRYDERVSALADVHAPEDTNAGRA